MKKLVILTISDYITNRTCNLFIKDKNNLISFNAWTGTDYLKNTNEFNNHPLSSTEWSINGERSLKLTNTEDNYEHYSTSYYQTLPTGTYIIQMKLYSPVGTGRIGVMLKGEDFQNINYSASDNVQNITITVTNKTIIGLRFYKWTVGTSVYIDDLKIQVQ